MTPEVLSKINLLSGYKLFEAMKWAYKSFKNDYIHALLERAMNLNAKRFGSWAEAKAKLEAVTLPKELEHMDNLCGYPMEIITTLSENGGVKEQKIAIFNGKFNQAYVRYFIKNSNVNFQ